MIISKFKLDHITPLLKLCNGFQSLLRVKSNFPTILTMSYLSLHLISCYSQPSFYAVIILYFLLFVKHTKVFPTLTHLSFTYILPLNFHMTCSFISFTFLYIIFFEWLLSDQPITLYFFTINVSSF